MAKGDLLIQYGKVTIAASARMGVTIDKLKETLNAVLEKWGYPEDTEMPDFKTEEESSGVEVEEDELDRTSPETTMDQIERVADRIDKTGDKQIAKLER